MNSVSTETSEKIYDTGVIHGRFQVLHNDHLKYILAGKRICHHIVVGITNPDPVLTKKESVDPNRDNPVSNPLTYFERYILVNEALIENGLTLGQFSVVPFPINLPELYKYYVPLNAMFFLTIYDDWGRKKMKYFQHLGLKTHVLREVPPEQKGISASYIRDCMINNKPWKHLLPESVAKRIIEWRIPKRLKEIKNSCSFGN